MAGRSLSGEIVAKAVLDTEGLDKGVADANKKLGKVGQDQAGGGLSSRQEHAGLRKLLGREGVGLGGELLEGAGFAGLAAGFGIALFAAKKLTDTIIGFAKAASPAAGERWDLAWADLFAVVGKGFVPLLESMTVAVRYFADQTAAVVNSLMEGAASLDTAIEGTPLLGSLSKIGDTEDKSKGFFYAVDKFIDDIDFLGITRIGDDKTLDERQGASVGASGVQAKFAGIGSLEDEQIAAAFSRPGMSQATTPMTAEEAREIMQEYMVMMREIADKQAAQRVRSGGMG
jgi:hypothetical protein